jgi:hypothetical protein
VVPGGALPLVVLFEQAVPEVVAVVAPDGVNVVAVVDRVVELDEGIGLAGQWDDLVRKGVVLPEVPTGTDFIGRFRPPSAASFPQD